MLRRSSRKREGNLVPSDWFILDLSLMLGHPGKDKSLMSITDSAMPDAVIQCKYAIVQLCFTPSPFLSLREHWAPRSFGPNICSPAHVFRLWSEELKKKVSRRKICCDVERLWCFVAAPCRNRENPTLFFSPHSLLTTWIMWAKNPYLAVFAADVIKRLEAWIFILSCYFCS